MEKINQQVFVVKDNKLISCEKLLSTSFSSKKSLAFSVLKIGVDRVVDQHIIKRRCNRNGGIDVNKVPNNRNALLPE